MDEQFISQLKHDVQAYDMTKYEVSREPMRVLVDELTPQGESRVRIQVTISSGTGFITRHYGTAGYRNNHLEIETMSI